jgi:hypothetical protein
LREFFDRLDAALNSAIALSDAQRRVQALLDGPARHVCLAGGSRAGKTFLIMRKIVERANAFAGSLHAVLRFRNNAARASISLGTLPAVVRRCFPGLRLEEHRNDGYFGLPNGSQIWIGGLDDKDRVEKILGNEYATVFLNEASQIPYSSVLVALTRLAQHVAGLPQRLFVDLNPVATTHWTNVLFGEKRDPVTRQALLEPEDYVRAYLNPSDNAANLSSEYLRSLENLPERQRRRFFEGRYVETIDGALWPLEVLDRCRLEDGAKLPDMQRVLVAIDPSGTSGGEDSRSDDVGIVIVGKGVDGKAYLLDDRTCNLPPAGWARVAVTAYHEFSADCLIAEKNFGGAMVGAVVRTADPSVAFREVVASRGKAVRAEPVAALYEVDKVRHVGRFVELEDELAGFSTAGYLGRGSPDRADALIWGISELMLGGSSSAEAWIDHYAGLAKAARSAPLPAEREEIFPWRSRPKPQPAPPGNDLTRSYFRILEELERPGACPRCGGAIVKGAPTTTDGFEAWHVECRPN